MYDDDVRIRPAKPEEAEDLSDIAWRSKSYWDYPVDVMNIFRDMLSIEQDFIENNPSYLIEHEDTDEKVGFYALEKKGDNGGLNTCGCFPTRSVRGWGASSSFTPARWPRRWEPMNFT